MGWLTTTPKRLLVALTLSALGALGGGCGNERPGGVADTTRTGMNDHVDPCATPNVGCACDEPARVVECGTIDRESAGHIWCSMGHRTCSADGTWSDCQAEFTQLIDAPMPGVKEQTLGTPAACLDNPCDPYCRQVTDSGNDIMLPTGFQQAPGGGVTLLPRDASLAGSGCTGIKVSPTPQTLTIKGLGAATPGLKGDYFNQRFGDGPVPDAATPTATRLDSQVSFTWPGSPLTGVGADNFTVRWTGYVRPKVSGSYTFCTTSDDGVRLWVGGTKVVDHWSDHGSALDCSAATNVTAGTLYPVRMEFYENGGDAVAALRWTYSGAPGGEVIPSDALVPPGAEMQLGPLVVDPPNAQFTVGVVPAGCFDGPVSALWSIDRLDRASVDSNGKVTLFAPVAGDVTVTAYAGMFSAQGVVKVSIDASDVTLAPAGSVATFQNAPSGTDPMTVLYPYVDTVFPLALRAPTIQWDAGGTAASAVKIALRAPATGAAIFNWSAVVPDSAPGRFTVPQEVWSALGATAKGKTASYSVQRITSGVARPPVVRNFQFAKAPLRGKIYYTQYARDGSTNMMVTDPGSGLAASSAFASETGGAWGKCPVCHTVSASGNMFATGDTRWTSNPGLSRINTDGSFTLLGDYTATADPYQKNADDWRGFAWAPLTPDGKLALAANNIWGNSKQAVVGIDPNTRAIAIPGGFESGGNGTGLLAKYYMNQTFAGWDWRRVDPKIDFDWTGAAPGGPVPAAFSAAWSGQVQAFTSESYTFSVQTNGGVKLTVGGQVIVDALGNAANNNFTGTATLVRGAKTPIALSFASGAPNPQLRLIWSSPTVDPQVIPQTQLYPNDGLHGVLATYYDANNFTNPFITDRLEASLNLDYGAGRPAPMPSNDNDNWSAVYRGQLEAPASGTLKLCADADDDVVVTLAGTQIINHAGAAHTCAATGLAVTAGSLYDVEVRLREYMGNAHVTLTWQMSGTTTFGEEPVPSARLRPPAGYAAPVHGVTATYYDDERFNGNEATGSPVLAATRVEQNLDLDWGDSRPDQSALTDSDYFSSRFTGQIETTCADIYEFQLDVDDRGKLWIDGVRLIDVEDFTVQKSAIWLDAGKHDLKLDHVEGVVAANVSLSWKARCMNSAGFTPVPNDHLYPDGDQGTGGYELAGGDNGSGTNYFVWQTPGAPGPATDVTATSPGVWGLGDSVMMVPSFAPDGSKLVFVDGDSAGGNGWRKGLSVFDFDQVGKAFKHRKTVVSTWPSGDVMKWPVFESDSRSVIYQQTVPGDVCCRKTDWTKYGYMGPTNYFEDPGRLFSVDTQAANPVPVELATLNRGERALDRNKAYQATMLPQASAGYRWAVFTSTRPYGNTLNLQTQGQQDFSNTAAYTYISQYDRMQSMLWVSAIDDTPSAGADRSHPAFFLPAQNFNEDPANGFINERAYWVTEACRPAGTGAGSSCDVDEDCCGGSDGTAVCRIDTPTTVPPTRHCYQIPAQCVAKGQACVTSAACCTGTVCDDGLCVKPPPLNKFQPGNFERIYQSDCSSGQKVDWTFFDYKASVPAQGSLEFYAESADDLASLHTLPAAPNPVNIDGVVLLGTQLPPGAPTTFTYIDVNAKLKAASVVDRPYLKITVRFTPNTDGTEAPVLTDWQQSFSCPPGE